MRFQSLIGLPALFLAALPATAQVCNQDNFFINDSLSPDGTGLSTFSVIPGLCENEAAGVVFDLPSSGAQALEWVSVGFGSNGGISGNTALINIEVYDGVTFQGSNATLGPKVFDFANDVGGNLQVTSSGINEIDLSAFGVVVGISGNSNFVVAARMLFNPDGTCAAGFNSNFITDNTQSGLFGCSPTITPPGRNLIDISGQGWQDASLATVTGIPLCPLFYSGNWAIRSCGQDLTPGNPLQVDVQGSPVAPGGFVNLTFEAPGFEGDFYLAAASLGTSPGIPFPSGNPAVFQTFPLNPDAFFNLSLSQPSVFVNFFGAIGATGTAPGLVILPNNPNLSGLEFFIAFVTLPPGPTPYGVSDPASVLVQ